MKHADPNIDSLLAQSRWLEGLAMSLLSDRPGETDDLVQDVWLAALGRPPRADRAGLRGWLRRVTGNLAIDLRRQRRTSGADLADGAAEEAGAVVEKAEEHRRLVEALLGLDEPYRSTLLLRFFEGLSIKQIARRLARPETTVRTHQRRGLARMREKLTRERGGAWRSGCAALLGPPVAARRTVWLKGWWIVKMNVKVAVAVLLLIAGVAMLVRWRTGAESDDLVSSTSSPPPAARETARAGGSSTDEDEAGPPAAEPTESEDRAPATRVATGDVVFHPVPHTEPIGGTAWRLEPAGRRADDVPFTLPADGRVRLPSGRWHLVSSTDQWRPSSPEVTIAAGESTPVWVVQPTRIEVFVRDVHGAPISSASLRWLTRGPAAGEAPRAHTDATGRAVLEELPGPVGMLQVSARGFQDEIVHRLGATKEALEVVMVAGEGSGFHLDVRDQAGGPLGSATARLVRGPLVATADAEGRLELPAWVERAESWVEIRAPHHVPHFESAMGLVRRTAIELAPSAATSVRVLDRDGAPIAGARLSVAPADGTVFLHALARMADAVTGADGRTRLELPLDRETVVHATTSDGRSGRVSARGTGDELTIVLGEGGGLIVRLEDEDGQPVPHGRVLVHRMRLGRRTATFRAGEDGSIRVPDPGCVIRLEAGAPGHVSRVLQPTRPEGSRDVRERSGASAGAPPSGGRLRLTLPQGHDLTGRVVDSAGAPLAGIELVLWFRTSLISGRGETPSTPTEHPAWSIVENAPRRTVSAADGRFRFRAVPTGSWRIQTALPGQLDPWRRSLHDSDDVAIEVPSAGEIIVELPGFRLVTLRVVDAGSGEPVTDFRVRRIPLRTFRTDLHFRMTWQGWIPRRTEEIEVSAAGYDPEIVALEPGAREPVDATVRLTPARAMTIHFSGDAAEALEGRRISIAALAPTTNAEGRTFYFLEWQTTAVAREADVAVSLPFADGKHFVLGVDGYSFDPDRLEWEAGSEVTVSVTRTE